MTTLIKLTSVFILGLVSCSNEQTKSDTTTFDTNKSDNVQNLDVTEKITPTASSLIPDSIKRFVVDNYSVTDKMLEDTTSDNSSYPIKIGDMASYDKAWFKNDALGQTMVYELYTDKHRLTTFHFYNNNIPEPLIDRLVLHTRLGDFATLEQKKKNIKKFIGKATKIKPQFFTSNKGFELGDSRQKAVNMYGVPDNQITENNFEILEWEFVGDILYDPNTDLKGKPLAKDSYGHRATMFFKDDKLKAIILYNNIP